MDWMRSYMRVHPILDLTDTLEVTIMFSRKNTRQFLLILLAAALFLTACNVGAEPEPTVDVTALSTALVGTTVAELAAQATQTALAAPTNTPPPTVDAAATSAALPTLDLSGAASPTTNVAALPTFSFVNTPVTTGGTTPVVILPTSQATASLGDECNNSVFEEDVTIPDGTVIEPGHNFQKIWKIRNTGNCTWDDGYSLVYIGGSTPNLDPVNFNFRNSQDFVSSGEAINIAINLTTPCQPGSYEGHWRMRSDSGYYFGTIISVYVKVNDDC